VALAAAAAFGYALDQAAALALISLSCTPLAARRGYSCSPCQV
jgi:hypothetical protein